MELTNVALICKALGDSNRLEIVQMLSDGEKCGCRLLEKFEITQPTLSHHMKILVECGLVNDRKEGKWHHYSLNCDTLLEFKNFIGSLTCESCCDKKDSCCYEKLVKEIVDYESLEVTHHDDMRQVDEIVNLIVETVMCKNDKILIASNWYPASLVKKKFLMLTYSHIEYVLHCMSGNTTKVKNIKKYLLAALFNAPSTMNGYYQAEVNHDMPGLVR